MQQLVNDQKALRTLRKTPQILAAVLATIPQEEAATRCDGPGGWSILEIVCHLDDVEELFTQRVRDLLAGPEPVFQVVSNEEMMARGQYTQRDLQQALASFHARRAALIELVGGLTDEQWHLRGTHPVQGPATLLDVVINVGLHDVDHIEQILRCR